ncbi:BZ3500_MvSof-1268-A1-R1_Chr3-1g06199 [Microbotryum saponariae]|uniref:BZ3500_MvSof-1268-A1-R1_Chr3-1g06199 protein n=1 Tax=Microbotryum saponariae TaxID=289078 RepID=A0A2X0L436_9BASI|nr:BZ3500_MvSof-1268-A1-R1_Chr3-1g06199 [Microbotryum saponariae]
MRRKLRNGKGARAGICPGAGEIAGALRQSRAAKSPLQGRASGARPKTAGAGALRHSRAPNGLFTDFALGPQHDDCEAGSPGYYALKEESQDEDVNGQELGNLFLKEECHEFITPGESLLEERPYTSPSHDWLPPVDCAFGPWGHGYDAGSPGSPHLAENIMDAVDWSIGRLSPPIAVNRVHAIATAPANDPPIPVHADADELDLLGVATDDVNDTPVVHRPPDPLPQPFLDTVIRAYANDSQAQVIITDPLSWPMFRVTEEGRILRVHPDESISLFVPRGLATGVVNSDKVPSLRELVLSEIHRSVGCEESTLRSAQDLGARSEPGADLGARSEPGAPAQDLGARSEPGT